MSFLPPVRLHPLASRQLARHIQQFKHRNNPSVAKTPYCHEVPGFSFDGVDLFAVRHSSGDEFVLASATPIPEPETYALVFGLALGGFPLYRKREGRLLRLDPAL